VEVLARKKSLELQITKPQTRNPQITKIWARKSQIRKVPHLRKVRKSNKIFKSANLQICDLQNLFADRHLWPEREGRRAL
jgi:hypothetical protein